jgi:hypothetical protein
MRSSVLQYYIRHTSCIIPPPVQDGLKSVAGGGRDDSEERAHQRGRRFNGKPILWVGWTRPGPATPPEGRWFRLLRRARARRIANRDGRYRAGRSHQLRILAKFQRRLVRYQTQRVLWTDFTALCFRPCRVCRYI